MLVMHDVLDGVNRPRRNIGRLESFEDRVEGAARRPGTDGFVDLGLVLDAAVIVGETRIGREIGPPRGGHEPLEDAVAVATDDDVFSVAATIGIRGHDAGKLGALRLTDLPEDIELG